MMNKSLNHSYFIILIFISILFFSPRPALCADEENCILCHKHKGLSVLDENGDLKSFYVDNKHFEDSMHKKVNCRGCHTSVSEVPHKKSYKKVNCGIACHLKKSLSLGGYSHSAVYDSYMTSAHGSASDDTPKCLYCHKQNTTKKASKTDRLEVMATCAGCHIDDEKMKEYDIAPNIVQSYKNSTHAKIFFLEPKSSVICTDCHSLHNIAPKGSDTSPINKANLYKTCAGQETTATGCHIAYNPNFLYSFDHEKHKESGMHTALTLKNYINYIMMGMFYLFCIINIAKIVRD